MAEIKFTIPEGTPASVCKGCAAKIYFIKTKSGKQMPVDPDGQSHFSTCLFADRFRGQKESK